MLHEGSDQAKTAEDTEPSGEEISTPPPAAPNTIHKTLGAYNVLHEGSDQAKTAEDTEPSGEENITTPPGA